MLIAAKAKIDSMALLPTKSVVILDMLLKAGANPDVVTQPGHYTPLLLQARDDNTEAVALLLKAGANPNIKNDDKKVPLHFATQYNNTDMVKSLLDYKADPFIFFDHYVQRTGLHKAALHENVEMARLFLDIGISINCRDYTRDTPLLLAAHTGNVLMIEFLFENGANPYSIDSQRNTALHITILGHAKKNLEALQLLMKKNINLDLQNKYGMTVLHLAVKYKLPDFVNTLLKAGTRTDLLNNDGQTAFDMAIENNITEIIDIFTGKSSGDKEEASYNADDDLSADLESDFANTSDHYDDL